jgi:hypothetical protein
MKKLIAFFVFVFVATICSAQVELEGNKEGVYRIKENTQEWAPSEITAEPEAVKYIDNFSQAISAPDIPILVGQSEKILKLKPVFKKLVEVEEHFIVYKEDGDSIGFFIKVKKREEPSYLILFSIASILLMVISNILFKKSCDVATLAATFAVTAAFVAAFTFAAFAATFAFVFAAAFAFVAAVAFVAAAFADINYKVASIIFYILMVVHIILLFV